MTGLPARVGGLAGGGAWWALKNQKRLGRAVIAAADDDAARVLADDLNALARWKGASAPVAVHFSEEEMDAKVSALSDWSGGAVPFLTVSREHFGAPLPTLDEFLGAHRTLRLGDRMDRDDFVLHLSTHGYERADSTEKPGEFSVRGEVLDLWSPGWEIPARLLWPFDKIESIREIDLGTQRSAEPRDRLEVRPASLNPSSTPAFLPDYLDPDDNLVDFSPIDGLPLPRVSITAAILEPADEEAGLLPPPPLGPPENAGKELASFLKTWIADGGRAALFCHTAGEEERLEDILLAADRSLAERMDDGRIAFIRGDLQRGFLEPSEKLAVLSNNEIFARARRRWRLPKFSGGEALAGIGELKTGDYVVHERFGIGRYTGLSRVETGGVEADYLRLEYKGGDRVLVPLFEFRQVQKYIGAEGKRPRLSSLDTAAWERSKENVQAAVAELAAELLDHAARRASAPGVAYPPDTAMEREFAEEFLYELTADQARAIAEVKTDMESPRPMDRLVCGDVGYGKTEVALRAAMKAVSGGKQAAFLAPTTILAEQHGRNLRDRFADFPVRTASLTRFTPPSEEKKVLEGLKSGTVDVVVGTHRLLSADVKFKDLGLVIIDEEHRFGVKQKERIQAFRDALDVLALSATPIPRTLGAAIGGLKGLSIIESPPEGRLPISTHVGPLDEKVILAAVENELRRGGQVFYVHNRVGTIDARKAWLENTLKDHGLTPRVVVAHGQMAGPALEKTMWDFMEKKFDLLMATSIIESGLDIPSVNTLLVEEAEYFGLAQLYQLRGRVGREKRKAFCFLFHSPGVSLTDEAQKRLTALKEFASLGSGFKLALRDLEIRGAGNLLGPQQHGFVNAVGVDLYGRLLAEEIERQRDHRPAKSPERDPVLELPVSAFLPEEVLPSEAERVAFYKRLLDAPPSGLRSLREELEDRCGKLPPPVEELFRVAHLRNMAKRHDVVHIGIQGDDLELRLAPGAKVPPDLPARLLKKFASRMTFLPGPPDGMRLAGPFAEGPLSAAEDVLSSWGE